MLIMLIMNSIFLQLEWIDFDQFLIKRSKKMTLKLIKRLKKSTEPWWLSGLMCQSIINPMLKVEGSNPGASILKFGLFLFSKWLCLDKNNNLEISVTLLVLND